MRGWATVIACAAALVLSGCALGEPDGPPPKVEHPKAETPKDRDGQAVLAALRRIDPCALLDSGGRFPADRKPQASGPFTCSISRSDDAYADRIAVQVTTLGEQERSRYPLGMVGGAKAYTGIGDDPCRVSFPVSFEFAIEFSSYSLRREGCATARELAQVVAAKLANPDAVAAGAIWDACSVLRAANNGESGKYTYSEGKGLDGCQASAPLATLVLSHSQEPDQGTTVESVGGKRVAIREEGQICDIAWQNGNARTSNVWVSVQGSDCAKAKTMAERAMATLDSPPPETAPQRPLLYGPDDPDRPIPGACAFWEKPDQCQPYVEVPVPAEKGQKIRAAQADRNVDCAMSIEAVTKHFGAQWEPVIVTDRRGCTFVESTRSGKISVSTSPEPVSKGLHADGERDLTVAGHPGTVWASDNLTVIDVAVGKSVDADGTLHVSYTKPDQDRVQSVVTDILTKHFG